MEDWQRDDSSHVWRRGKVAQNCVNFKNCSRKFRRRENRTINIISRLFFANGGLGVGREAIRGDIYRLFKKRQSLFFALTRKKRLAIRSIYS